MKNIQAEFDFDYIIKLDSDTCLINLSILEMGYDYGGGAEGRTFYAWGPAYFLSRKCLKYIADVLYNPQILSNVYKYSTGEDVLTGATVQIFSRNELKIKINSLCSPGSLVPHHMFDRLNSSAFAAATKVGSRFKNKITQTEEDILEKMCLCKKYICG